MAAISVAILINVHLTKSIIKLERDIDISNVHVYRSFENGMINDRVSTNVNKQTWRRNAKKIGS